MRLPPVRSQGCFVSDGELNKLIDYWRTARRFNMIPAEESIQPKQHQTEIPKTAPPPKPPVSKPAAKNDDAPTKAVEAPVVNLSSTNAAEEAPTVVTKTAKAKSTPKPTTPHPKPKAPVQKEEPAQQPLWEALQEMESQPAQPEYEDELMADAIALVRELDKASTSLLQRRFRIGYTRAARMIDAMEDMGIIGPPTGTSKARSVMPWQDDSESETIIEGEFEEE